MVDAAIIGGLLTNIAPLIKDEFSLFWSLKNDVQKLSSRLSSLHAVLEDAERMNMQEKDKQTEDWLRKLKNVAYEVRDIMGECTFEDLRLEVKRLNASSSTHIQVTNCIALPFSNTWTRLKIGHKIRNVVEKLDQFSSERNNFHLRETTLDANPTSWRETKSKPSEKIYGRDNDKEKIVDILVHKSLDATKILSVLPILGLGGLGKTTLAQMVFNDEEITKWFDVKFWVCVSEKFDIKLVIKAIIGVTNATSLEILQNEIQDKLRGKKYLIVLDDVWNENVDEWNKLRSILDCGLNGSFILTTTRKKNVAEIMKTQVQPFELSSLSDDDCWQLFEERAFMYRIPKTISYIGIGKEIAKKCRGVPLIAKTLGGQLGFKRDEKDWCAIRDNEIWKIFENQESILPILRLSYYDLPYHLRRCFAFCAIFVKDTQIEKERLIQLWMAHDLIPINKNQEIENIGNTIWDELCWRSFFQDENEEIQTCKMHDFMHDLAQSVMKDECYTMDAKSSSEDFREEIRHLSIDKSTTTSTVFLKKEKMRGLQSIILFPDSYGTFSKDILSVLKELPSLRVFDVSRDVEIQDLFYVGCLKHLRYLNLSYCWVKTLPNSICDLLNLQTLNLYECYNLQSLPRNTKNLINLRHLHLKNCHALKYMPRGMGQLRHLKTLSLYVVGKLSDVRELEEDIIGQLEEVRDLDIGGYMEIKNFESVCDASVSRGGISMSQKSSINELVLHWNDSSRFHNDIETQSRYEKICEALEVPATRLKTLIMFSYKGVNIPKCVGESSASLIHLELYGIENVEHIFTMINNMNTSANSNEMNGRVVTLFPLLDELLIAEMNNLRELVYPPITTITTGAFPNLRKIEIHKCPRLGALPPHLKSLKTLKITGKCTVELLDSISDFSGLTRLSFTNIVNGRSVLFRAAAATASSNEINGTLFPLLEELVIQGMNNLRELMSPPVPITTTTAVREFPNLCKITIKSCPKLGALPRNLKSLKDVTVWGECREDLLDSILDLSGLTHLCVYSIDNERSVLFGDGNKADENENEITSSSSSRTLNEEQGGPASTFQSLQSLHIWNCDKLSRLFDDDEQEKGCEKLARRVSCLTNLSISFCPELRISLEQWRNLGTHSLQRLEIFNCPKLIPTKGEGEGEGEGEVEVEGEEGEEQEYDDDVMAILCSIQERLGKKNCIVDFLGR